MHFFEICTAKLIFYICSVLVYNERIWMQIQNSLSVNVMLKSTLFIHFTFHFNRDSCNRCSLIVQGHFLPLYLEFRGHFGSFLWHFCPNLPMSHDYCYPPDCIMYLKKSFLRNCSLKVCWSTSNAAHFLRRLATSPACSGATCCFTNTACFFMLFHFSGSTCSSKKIKKARSQDAFFYKQTEKQS